jgi:3-oxoadipate enol-lactonase
MKVRNDDVSIDVRVDGVRGETVVLLHGFPLSSAIWDSQVATLARSRRVVRIDLRGMGGSSFVPGPYLMETLAGDVAAVFEALGVAQATIVGHSLGGYVALAFLRMYTERVTRLALVCSRISADTPEQARERDELADRVERANSAQEIVTSMLPALFARETLLRNRDVLARAEAIASANDPRGLAAMLRGMARRDGAHDIAPDVTVPVLIVAGAADRVVAMQEAEQAAAAFPKGRLAQCASSGHLPMLEEPGALSRLLDAFSGGSGGDSPVAG